MFADVGTTGHIAVESRKIGEENGRPGWQPNMTAAFEMDCVTRVTRGEVAEVDRITIVVVMADLRHEERKQIR